MAEGRITPSRIAGLPDYHGLAQTGSVRASLDLRGAAVGEPQLRLPLDLLDHRARDAVVGLGGPARLDGIADRDLEARPCESQPALGARRGRVQVHRRLGL